MKRQVLVYFGILGLMLPAFAASATDVSLSQNFGFSGTLTDSGGNPITTSTTVDFKILDPSTACLLYDESKLITPDAQGNFSTVIGSAPGAVQRVTGTDPSIPMAMIFQNDAPVAGAVTNPGGSTCTGYAPAPGDGRLLRITVASTVLSPDFPIGAVPAATVAETLQGLRASQFLQAGSGSSASLNQANLATLFTSVGYANLQTVAAGGFAPASSNGTQIQSFATAPGSPVPGDLWFNSSTHQLSYFDGTTSQTLQSGGASGVTSIATGTGLTGGPITTSGTLAVNVGTSAGQIVQVQTGGKLPALDGSNLTNLSLTGLASPIATSAAISTTGALTAATITAPSLSTNNSYIYNSANTHYVDLTSPAAVTNYTLVLPLALPPAAGYVLSSDASGNMSWAAPGGGGSTFANGGNSFGAAAILGTNDANSLSLRTNNINAITITQSQAVGIGTIAPSSMLQVFNGEAQVGFSGAACSVGNAGAIRYNSSILSYCNGSAWNPISSGGTSLPETGGLMTGSIQGADGMASVPGYSFAGDSSTGIYDVSPGTLGFSSNGLQTFTMSSSSFSSTNAGGAQISTSGGSASVPTFSFVGDSGTGWFHPTVGSLAASTGAVERMRINSTGSVGIGTTAPAFMLDVHGPINTTGSYMLNGAPILNWNPAFTSLGVGPNALAVVASGSGNNVAMGPQALGLLSSGGGNTGLGARSGMAMTSGSNNTLVGAMTGADLTIGSTNVLIGYGVGSNTLTTGNGNILIGTSPSVDVPTASTNNFMNIGNVIYSMMSSGMVGIGTPTPQATLDVNGHIGNSNVTTPPSNGGCTGMGTVSGNDVRGTINFTSTGSTSCQINFLQSYPTAPTCVVSWNSSTAVTSSLTATTTTTYLKLLFTTPPSSGQNISYICFQ